MSTLGHGLQNDYLQTRRIRYIVLVMKDFGCYYPIWLENTHHISSIVLIALLVHQNGGELYDNTEKSTIAFQHINCMMDKK